MTKSAPLILAVSLALAASAASAADGDITLRVDGGTIMTSTGGEFATAQTGKVLIEGQRMMVTEGASATVFYDRDCRREYTAPGVYEIERDCKRAVALVGNDWASVGKLALAGAVGVAILVNMDDSGGVPSPVDPPPPPISR